ncbi:hypothetical protein [Xylocopilactobacillus apicola]|uniref:Uncharacterized protein n=1 Tax=Xylocopilactobacillus apicola TaxID=2932184 RepID=A0AAU9DQE4_9LACO|nr:hypothetical protein [Xylocopilactobacillus apicola]BDR58099.1 hypothetical protein XA3_05400 [Xylocopilactobacillus apicola]
MMENYIGTLESLQLSIQKVQHDYNNLLSEIDGFITADNVDIRGIKEYLIQNKLLHKGVQIKAGTLDQLKRINLPAVKGVVSTKVIMALQEK